MLCNVPRHIANRIITLKHRGANTILLLPMSPSDPSSEGDIKILLNAIRPRCVIVDTCNYRMKALHPYVSRSESHDHFQPHAVLDRLRAGSVDLRDFSRIWWHLILNNNSSMTSLVRLSIDYVQNSLNTMPGADVVLAYKTSSAQGCKQFFCLDRGYNTSIDRLYSGLSFKEWFDFAKIFFSTLNAQLAVDTDSGDDRDRETLESSRAVIAHKFRWFHHITVVERGVLFGLQMKRLSSSLQPAESKDSSAEGHTLPAAPKEGQELTDDASKGKLGGELPQAAQPNESNLTVAFINTALVPYVVLSWSEERTDADAVDLINRLSGPTENCSAQEMRAYVQKVKELQMNEEIEFAKTGHTQGMIFAEKLNGYRGVKFSSARPFQEADILNGGSKIYSSDQSLHSHLGSLRNAPFPFDMIHLGPKAHHGQEKSLSFSRLRS